MIFAPLYPVMLSSKGILTHKYQCIFQQSTKKYATILEIKYGYLLPRWIFFYLLDKETNKWGTPFSYCTISPSTHSFQQSKEKLFCLFVPFCCLWFAQSFSLIFFSLSRDQRNSWHPQKTAKGRTKNLLIFSSVVDRTAMMRAKRHQKLSQTHALIQRVTFSEKTWMHSIMAT